MGKRNVSGRQFFLAETGSRAFHGNKSRSTQRPDLIHSPPRRDYMHARGSAAAASVQRGTTTCRKSCIGKVNCDGNRFTV